MSLSILSISREHLKKPAVVCSTYNPRDQPLSRSAYAVPDIQINFKVRSVLRYVDRKQLIGTVADDPASE